MGGYGSPHGRFMGFHGEFIGKSWKPWEIHGATHGATFYIPQVASAFGGGDAPAHGGGTDVAVAGGGVALDSRRMSGGQPITKGSPRLQGGEWRGSRGDPGSLGVRRVEGPEIERSRRRRSQRCNFPQTFPNDFNDMRRKHPNSLDRKKGSGFRQETGHCHGDLGSRRWRPRGSPIEGILGSRQGRCKVSRCSFPYTFLNGIKWLRGQHPNPLDRKRITVFELERPVSIGGAVDRSGMPGLEKSEGLADRQGRPGNDPETGIDRVLADSRKGDGFPVVEDQAGGMEGMPASSGRKNRLR